MVLRNYYVHDNTELLICIPFNICQATGERDHGAGEDRDGGGKERKRRVICSIGRNRQQNQNQLQMDYIKLNKHLEVKINKASLGIIRPFLLLSSYSPVPLPCSRSPLSLTPALPSRSQLSTVTIVHTFEAHASTEAPRSMYLQYTITGPGHGALPIYNVISCIAFPVTLSFFFFRTESGRCAADTLAES